MVVTVPAQPSWEERLEELGELTYAETLDLAKKGKLSELDETTLANHPETKVREALAMNTALGDRTKTLLAQDQDGGVRGTLCIQRTLPEDAVNLLARDRDPWVRLCLAKLQTLTDEACRLLSYEESPEILWAVGVNQGLPLRDPDYDLEKAGEYSAKLAAEIPTLLQRAAAEYDVQYDVLKGLAGEWEGSFGTLVDAGRALKEK